MTPHCPSGPILIQGCPIKGAVLAGLGPDDINA